MPTKEQVTEKLTAVIDPELRKSIVEPGMVRSIEIGGDGRVEVVVSLTTPGCPIRSHFEQAVAREVSSLEGVRSVGVAFDVLSDEEKGRLREQRGAILEHATKVGEGAADDVPPTTYAIPRSNVLRPDEITSSLPVEEVLANAPEVEDDRFRVPKIVEVE